MRLFIISLVGLFICACSVEPKPDLLTEATQLEWSQATDTKKLETAKFWSWVMLGKPDESSTELVEDGAQYLMACLNELDPELFTNKASQNAVICWNLRGQ